MLIISFVLVMAYVLGVPLLYGTSVIPPSLPTSIAFFAMGVALFALSWPSFGDETVPVRSTRLLVGVFLFLTAGILTAGSLIYRSYTNYYRTQIEQELSSIAKIKVAEIQQWKDERLQDAKLVLDSTNFQKLVRRYFLNKSDRDAKKQLEDWLRRYSKHGSIDQTRLLNPKGVTVLCFPPKRPPTSTFVASRIQEVIKSKSITVVDFYRHPYDQRIFASILVPILDKSAEKDAIGVVSMRLDPQKQLFPIVLHWPTPGNIGEISLVRRDGDAVLVLSKLRFQENSAMNLRIPLDKINNPSVMAVLGKTGVVEGIGYPNEVPVMADVRAVPDSPWFLVAGMNADEVYAEAQLNLWTIAGFVIALIFASGAVIAFLWRKQSIDFYRRQHESAEALRESETTIRSIGDNLPNAMLYQMIVDKSGNRKLTFVSETIRKFYGCTPEEAMADVNRLYGRFFKEDRERFRKEEDAAIEKRSVFQSEARVYDPSSGLRWSHWASRPRLLADGRTIWDGVEFDITKNKQVESDLLAAKQAAEAAVRSKATFVDIAAHELRNPITAFSLLLQYFQKQIEKGHPLSKTDFDRLKAPADRISDLVSDLLDVSRMERGLVVLRPVQIDMASLVAKNVEEFLIQVPKRHIRLTKPDHPVEIEADPVRINQVLSNLIDNAIKYTPKDRPIEVTVEQTENTVRVSVVDHGAGIPKEDQQDIFAPFSRGTTETTTRASGLGLGLSICRAIIELHQGTIGVLSEAGQGSTFYFELPKQRPKA